jgi:methionyl-tRNA formyltransferase
MRLVFAGTPEFARIAFTALLAAGHQIVLVLTQPDRPAGRGLTPRSSPVKQAALEAKIEVIEPRSLRLDGRYAEAAACARRHLERAAPDVLVVAAYGLLLPQWVLDLPRLGCLNIHASLLPRWRGAAPIARAIEAGDTRSGVSIMQMDAGLDTGDLLLTREIPLDDEQTALSLHNALAELGAQAMLETLRALAVGGLRARKQPHEGVLYAAKLSTAESLLDCRLPAAVLARKVRAFNPVPGARIGLPGLAAPVKVWRAQALNAHVSQAPASILRVSTEGIDIATAQGVLRLLVLQKAGGKRQSVADFVRGWRAPVA